MKKEFVELKRNKESPKHTTENSIPPWHLGVKHVSKSAAELLLMTCKIHSVFIFIGVKEHPHVS